MPGPAVRLCALGPPSLTAPSGEVRAVLQQPKRLALLSYLLLQGGEAGLRRDELLATFWPQLDDEHGRAALRRALYFLRRELSAEALSERPDGRLVVEPGLVSCDAVDFRSAIARRDHHEALGMYRGVLLEGVFISGAPDAERWLDAERDELARLAARAAWALVEEPGLSADEMVERARRAMAVCPNDEVSLRRLLSVLHRAGDRAGALRTYEGFALQLRHTLGTEPSAETRALAEQLRAPPEVPGRQPRLDQLLSSPALPDPNLVAICPFAVQAPDRLAYLGEAAMQLLTATLSGAGPVRTVEPAAVLAVMSRAGGRETVDEAVAMRVARHFAAGHFLVGSIVESGGRLRGFATLFARDGTSQGRFDAEVQSESFLFELIDSLAIQIFTALAAPALAGLARSAVRATSSLPALKHYLAGESAMRGGRPEAAREAFTLATGDDPGFALAHYRLAGSFAAGGLVDLARASSGRAIAHRDRLADPERQLVEAHHAWLAGHVDQAEQIYQTIVAGWPESIDAWFHLGDVLFHANPERGRSMEEARFSFERVLVLDPNHVGAMVHLARLDALGGRRASAVERLDRVLELGPSGDLGFSLRALRAWLGDATADRQAVLKELPTTQGIALANGFAEITLHARDLDGAIDFGRATLAVARSEEFRALCHLGLAHLLLAVGRDLEASDEFDAVARIRPPWAVGARSQLLVLPGASAAPTELALAREQLADPAPAPAPFALPLLLRTHETLFEHVRLYILGLVAIRSGDLSRAAELVETMSEIPVPDGTVAMIQRFTRTLEAELLRARGNLIAALARLRRPGPAIWYQLAVASPFFTGMHERLLHGLVLREMGDERAARAWWATIGRRSPYELAALPAARRLLAAEA